MNRRRGRHLLFRVLSGVQRLRGLELVRPQSNHLAALLLMGAVLGCATPEVPSLATAPPGPEIARSMDVRTDNGLRSDRRWVESVSHDPTAVTRFGILVSAGEAAEIDRHQLQQAIELRRSFGLRSDADWVRGVIGDPDSVTRMGGLLLSEDEAASWDARVTSARAFVPLLNRYGRAHRSEWAGFYADTAGNFVIGVTGDIAAHRIAIEAMVAPGALTVEVRPVRWSTQELNRFAGVIRRDQAWFTDNGIDLEGYGPSVQANRVRIEIKTPEVVPGLVEKAVRHFDGDDWLAVEYSVDRALALEEGSLIVTVVDASGAPVEGVQCWLHPDVPGAAGELNEADTNSDGVCAWTRGIGATGYDVEVWRRFQDGFLGSGRVVVPPHDAARLTIRVAGG